MANVLPTTSTEGVEVIAATIPAYWKEAADLTKRGRIWWALMFELGLVEFNANTSFAGVWPAINKLPPVVPQGDSTGITFSESDSLIQFTTDLRGYRATDKLSHKKWLENKGNETQIINLYDHKTKQLLKAMRKMMGSDFYVDGHAAGNQNRYCGYNSFTGAGSCAVGDRVAMPSDTYAGVSTALGAHGGTWSDTLDSSEQYNATLSKDWPDGHGSEEYDGVSPLLVNITSSAWRTGSQFALNCEEVLRFAFQVQQNRGGTTEDMSVPPIALMQRKLYGDATHYFAIRNQQLVPVQEAANMGFVETLNFEGCWLTFDYDTPSNEVYLISPGGMEYFTPQDDLFQAFGPEWTLTEMAFLYLVSNYGNFRWQPKLFSKLANYAAA